MDKIRVLQCVTSMNRGGLETLIINFYRNIDKQKFQFDFLVQRSGRAEYYDEIEKLGGKIYCIPAFNPFNHKKYLESIDSFFKEHAKDYDIVHAHNNSFAMYIIRAAKKYGVKVRISHSHIAKSMINIKYPFVLYNKLKLKKYCNVQFACGKDAGKWLFKNNKSTIIPNAIDVDRFQFNIEQRNKIRNKYRIDNNTIIIGHIGRFNKQKNHKLMIKIIRYLMDKNYDAKLMLIGTGTLENKIKRIVKKEKLEGSVIFTESIGNVNEYINAFDVFILPSFIEGLPVVLIEAQAHGIQCLVSDSVPAECKITPLVTFISLKENYENWAQKAIELSKIKRKDMIDSIVNSGFEIKTATKNLEKEYIKLIEEMK